MRVAPRGLGPLHLTAFLAGATSLALEVVLVRVLAFFLTSAQDFLAIPIALLGLALGSWFAHSAWRGGPERLVSVASAALLPVTAGSLLLLFAAFDLWFDDVNAFLATLSRDTTRLAVDAAILVPPFTVFGALFAALFASDPKDAGRLYAADLSGAAVGCVVAPVLLTVSGLTAALMAVLGGALLLFLVAPRPAWVRGLGVAGFLGCAALGATGAAFTEHPDPRVLAHATFGRDRENLTVVEEAVRWNEIARTSLVRIDRPDRTSYYVVQDNGLSNVTVQRWPTSAAGAAAGTHDLAWRLGRDPQRILVMFAGAGRDMMNLDVLSGGAADITGVELNPAVRSLAEGVPGLGVDTFLRRPNVHLEVREGRDFLDHDHGRYDLIHVANNGAVQAARTGHTRRFLDTREALEAYLDHLSPRGVLLFADQPVADKIEGLRDAFAARGLGELEDAVAVLGGERTPNLRTLVVSPSGLSAADVAAIEDEAAAARLPVLYAGRRGDLDALASGRPVTDDRPFTRGLELATLDLDPSGHEHDLGWISSWVKVLTVLFAGAVCGLASLGVLAVGRGPARVPARWVGYLAVTGVGYLCVELGLIARTELLVGNPLYAVALDLAVFLVASAVGAATSGRPLPLGRLGLALATSAGVLWSLTSTAWLTEHALSAPLWAKVPLIPLTLGPAGVALGRYYPTAVAALEAEGRAAAVPATYALTTLSSVLGSVLAATAMIELGFHRVVVAGAALYLVACALLPAPRSGPAGHPATNETGSGSSSHTSGNVPTPSTIGRSTSSTNRV